MPSELTLTSPAVADVKQELSEILKSPLFRQAPKLRRLLEYVCNKALLQEGEKVTEYTIAIDVFGKSANFKENKDSSVRVEIYRLRKRLAQFYDSDGRDRPIRIILPQGHYSPEFLFAETHSEILVKAVPPVAVSQPLSASASSRSPFRGVTPLVITLCALALAGQWLYRSNSRKTAPAKKPDLVSRPKTASVAAASLSNIAPVRIMAGYSGPPHRDISGKVWGPDRFFQGGRPYRRDIPRIGRTYDQLLYQTSRMGDSAYDIPLAPGDYELHLYFMEPEFGPEVGRGENDRTFFLHLNDRRLEPAIDIESDAMGPNIADERVFKEVHPGPNGKLHIAFESGTGVPIVNAIEILPGLPHAQLPVRLVTQSVPFTDHLGTVWQPDNYYRNGQTCPRNEVVTGTSDPALFSIERYGHFDYAIPADVRSLYTVTLHFAESYFGPSALGRGGVGSRVFNVTCNGILLFPNLDIFKEAGSGHALTKTANHIKPTAQGKLNLTFEPVDNYALVNAIEVLDESR